MVKEKCEVVVPLGLLLLRGLNGVMKGLRGMLLSEMYGEGREIRRLAC
jgi:hypothetical protein